MPDISMCLHEECSAAHKCFRFLATPNNWQSYCDWEPEKGDKCNGFYDINKRIGKYEKGNRTEKS